MTRRQRSGAACATHPLKGWCQLPNMQTLLLHRRSPNPLPCLCRHPYSLAALWWLALECPRWLEAHLPLHLPLHHPRYTSHPQPASREGDDVQRKAMSLLAAGGKRQLPLLNVQLRQVVYREGIEVMPRWCKSNCS